jgi:hypothetical protein
MANVKLGGGVTDLRGSIGGTTFSRGPAGAIARQRVKPINPATPLQNARRAVLSALSLRWSAGLTPTERADWNAYALATNFQNKVGDTIQISGLACFVRLNSLMILMGKSVVTAAPLLSGQAAQTAYQPQVLATAKHVCVLEPTAGFDKSVVGEYLVVFAGLPMHIGRTSGAHGWRYVGNVAGAVVPPVFPMGFDWPYIAPVGEHYPMSVTHIDVSNRVSTPSDTLAVVIAA